MFYYTVSFWPEDKDTYENHLDGRGTVTEHGIIAAKNYGKAVNRVVEFYGKDNIIEISIYELENPLCMEEIQELDKF
jgi:hypothetical protein